MSVRALIEQLQLINRKAWMSSVMMWGSSVSNGIRSNRVRLNICSISYKRAERLRRFLARATSKYTETAIQS